jgi:hypothetical protein
MACTTKFFPSHGCRDSVGNRRKESPGLCIAFWMLHGLTITKKPNPGITRELVYQDFKYDGRDDGNEPISIKE